MEGERTRGAIALLAPLNRSRFPFRASSVENANHISLKGFGT